MKKLLVLIIISISLFSFTNPHHQLHKHSTARILKTDSVFICVSGRAYAYHSTLECRGLQRCTHQIIKISLYEAVNKYGYRACKICE